jgi:hypothetical protein
MMQPMPPEGQGGYARKVQDIAIERDQLKTANAELIAALESVSHWQRAKCEDASAEMLFMLLDNKVGIALIALAKTKEPTP